MSNIQFAMCYLQNSLQSVPKVLENPYKLQDGVPITVQLLNAHEIRSRDDLDSSKSRLLSTSCSHVPAP